MPWLSIFRLISAANAQMLFHYWKIDNYILYHQNRQGWGGKVIKKLAQAIRFNYPEKKGYSVRNLAYMCQFTRYYLLQVCKNHGQNPKSKQCVVYARTSCTNSRCSPNSNHRLPDADWGHEKMFMQQLASHGWIPCLKRRSNGSRCSKRCWEWKSCVLPSASPKKW